ncbi:Gfo/Idh/MocA family protein [Novipirellula sp. SH528]|uniref:Gfo/Idh/MocA family protein n=1 Tax=Novipirellula sp. SH528 TaxID=3454466 RepID=UPI003F9EECC6
MDKKKFAGRSFTNIATSSNGSRCEARKFGIVGIGSIAKFYLSAMKESAEVQLISACDLQPEKLKRFGGGTTKVTTDFSQLTSDPEIDGIIVCLPNYLHAEVCEKSLLAGKHVCCEKPLALNAGDSMRLAQLADKKKLVLMTAFHRKYNSNIRRAIQHCHATSLKRVRIRYLEDIEAHSGGENWYLDKEMSGGGCIIDNGSNALDLLSGFMRRIRVVDCRVERWSGAVEVSAVINLEDESGILAEVQLDWGHSDEIKDLTLEYEDGSKLCVNMLQGYDGFKKSLDHEYDSVVQDFCRRIQNCETTDDKELSVVQLVCDCYAKIRIGKY